MVGSIGGGLGNSGGMGDGGWGLGTIVGRRYFGGANRTAMIDTFDIPTNPHGVIEEVPIKSDSHQARWSTRLGVYEFPALRLRIAAILHTYSPKAVLHSVLLD